jgi:hypothetical protein
MRILMFGTVYCDTEEKLNLARQWMRLHSALNLKCDLVLVDSDSPVRVRGDLFAQILQLGDNIGHLARRGQDGWGRAFCAGLQYAIDRDYDYVVHVEGDSLLRLPVVPICEDMREYGLLARVCGVNGTKFREFAWVETGVMFLSVPYVRDSKFIERYDWPDGESKRYPRTPEAVVYYMLVQDGVLNVAPIRTMRDDKKVLATDNVMNYDWISHATPEVYDAFVARSMPVAA